ncbi:MAG: hypothetical protein GX786_05055, partial [Clostridiales bacterium]|nr:hypothetical protein [Clostridiales bacterium]
TTVKKADSKHSRDEYSFAISNPFDRGSIVGGFGYIVTEDSAQVILASLNDLNKRKEKAQSKVFWGAWEKEMYYKTLVHYVAKQIRMDPSKVAQYSKELHELSKPVQREPIDIDAEIAASLEEAEEEQTPSIMVLEEPEGIISQENDPAPQGQITMGGTAPF